MSNFLKNVEWRNIKTKKHEKSSHKKRFAIKTARRTVVTIKGEMYYNIQRLRECKESGWEIESKRLFT